jgi:hypothetical protein
LQRNLDEAGRGSVIFSQNNTRWPVAPISCNHLKVLRFRGCKAALFSQINGAAAKAFGDCVLHNEYSVTTHLYISNE